jgi:hypothetical protein
MSETVTTSPEEFYSEETQSLFPLDKYDSIHGVYNDVKYTVTYTPCQFEELVPIQGDYTLRVFKPDDDPLSDGGVVFYTEKHTEPEDAVSPVRELFVRARKIAREVSTRDEIVTCPYCGFMASTENRVVRRLSIFNRNGRWIPDTISEGSSCSGVSSLIPPKAEVYDHPRENLFFTQEELEDCESLIRTDGYPSWIDDSLLDPQENFRLQTLLEESPELFEDELDVETISSVVESFRKSSGRGRELIDRDELTYREEQ